MKERYCKNVFNRFKNCWPAIRKDVHGVILVYSAKTHDSSKKLKEYYDYFVSEAKIGPNNCVILFFDPDNTTSNASKIICKYSSNNSISTKFRFLNQFFSIFQI